MTTTTTIWRTDRARQLVYGPPMHTTLTLLGLRLAESTASRPVPTFWQMWGFEVSVVVIGVLIAFAAGARALWRRRPQACPSCNARMHRLDEASDDDYLTASERTEERIGTIDYEVWCCDACDEVLKLPHRALFTMRTYCPACSARTVKNHKHTITRSTMSKHGLARITSDCAHCGFHEVTLRRLRKRTPS